MVKLSQGCCGNHVCRFKAHRVNGFGWGSCLLTAQFVSNPALESLERQAFAWWRNVFELPHGDFQAALLSHHVTGFLFLPGYPLQPVSSIGHLVPAVPPVKGCAAALLHAGRRQELLQICHTKFILQGMSCISLEDLCWVLCSSIQCEFKAECQRSRWPVQDRNGRGRLYIEVPHSSRSTHHVQLSDQIQVFLSIWNQPAFDLIFTCKRYSL